MDRAVPTSPNCSHKTDSDLAVSRFPIAFAARVEVRVDGRFRGAGEGIVESDYFAVGRVGVPVQHRAAGIDDCRDVEIGILAVILIARAAARVGVVPADGQRVDIVRVPEVLVQRVGVAVLRSSKSCQFSL